MISERAIIESKIPESVNVWHNTHIREDVTIGENCNIGECIYIDKGVVIGENVKIQNGAQLYAPLTIEDNVFIGPGVIFCNDKHPRACKDFKRTTTVVKDSASIGAGAVILPGVTIPELAMIGAGAVVTKDLTGPFTFVGNPAVQIRWRRS